jgi:flagellar hook assembly protein FlgD
LGLSSPSIFLTAYPNPFVDNNTIRYRVESTSAVTIAVYDAKGQLIKVLVNQTQAAGVYSVQWLPGNIAKGIYFVRAITNGTAIQSVSLIKN